MEKESEACKGDLMRAKKTGKEVTIQKGKMKRAKEAKYCQIINSRPHETWSMTHPAHCYTSLCPDPQWRPERMDKEAATGWVTAKKGRL